MNVTVIIKIKRNNHDKFASLVVMTLTLFRSITLAFVSRLLVFIIKEVILNYYEWFLNLYCSVSYKKYLGDN